ncbi:MAG TPA: Yip1 family protein [Blastocatellia bacterium]|nr:Yip1 family protein [Blastocatellia bacterium]
MSETEKQTPEPSPSNGAPQTQNEQTPVEEPARLGPLSRLTGTLLSPGETFVDVNRKPTWLAPMIIAIVTVIASSVFFTWRVHPNWEEITRTQIKKRMEKSNQSISEEQLQQQVNIGKTIAKFYPIIGAIFTPVVYLIVAGIFALGMMLIQAKTTFKKILSVVSWTFAAMGILSSVVMIASLMVRDEEGLRNIDPTQPAGIVPTNLAVFLASDASPVIKAIAGSLDVFSIWILILLSIGFAAIAGSRKITTGKAATVVFGFWLVFVVIKVGWAAMFGA